MSYNILMKLRHYLGPVGTQYFLFQKETEVNFQFLVSLWIVWKNHYGFKTGVKKNTANILVCIHIKEGWVYIDTKGFLLLHSCFSSENIRCGTQKWDDCKLTAKLRAYW